MRGASSRRQNRRRGGYLLLPVSLMLAAIAAAAYAIILLEDVAGHSATQIREAREVVLVARAGMAHAMIEASSGSCSNYALGSQPFGEHSYSATYAPTSGSPVDIFVTATLASGAQKVLEDTNVAVYEGASAELVLQPDAADGVDTMISSSQSSRNFGISDAMWIGGNYVGLLAFDLSGLPPASRIQRATLELTRVGGWAGTVDVHRVTSTWTEGGCDGGPFCFAPGATWWTRDGYAGWSSAGGDYDARVWNQFDVSALGSVETDLTALVVAWQEGTPNRGLALTMSSGGEAEIASSDAVLADQRPKLTIEYACQCSPATTTGQAVLQPGAGFGKDTGLSGDGAGDQTKNFGASDVIEIEGSKSKLGIFEFDLAGLPPTATVTNAALELYAENYWGSDARDLSVHRITAAWTEGSGGSSGLDPADGATWDTRDGVTPWITPGGDFDPLEVDRVAVTDFTSQWYSWNVTDLVSDWQNDVIPNQGLLVRATSALSDKIEFTSSDTIDVDLRPKLTVDYACPCGLPCPTPGDVGENILMIVTDELSPSSEELAVEALIKSWRFVVTRLAQNGSQTIYDAALVGQDAVFVSSQASTANVGTKLSAARIGVAYEKANLADELAVASSVQWKADKALDMVDDTHYITANEPITEVDVLSTNESMASIDGSASSDLEILAERDSEGALVALEQGGEREDGQGPVEGRRVQLPWGSATHTSSHLTANGIALLRRAIEWAATPPPIPAGYLDRFENPLCDPAVDYARSHGSLDWSGSAWIESESTDACGGDVQINRRGDSYRLRFVNDVAIERAVDLSGFAVASLRFRYHSTGSIDSSHYLRIDASDDGGASWTELGRLEAPNAAPWEEMSFGLTPLIGPDTQIRLAAVGLNATRSIELDDVALVEASTAGGPCIETYLDSLGSAGYGGNDGSLFWSTDWIEVNESDGWLLGDELAASKNGSIMLRVADNDSGGEGLMREADLSSATFAYLTFEYLREQFDGESDYVSIQVSGDGGASWFTLDTIGGDANDAIRLDAIYGLDGYLAANTRIRFLTSPSLGGNDKFHFDEIKICVQ